MNPGRLKAVFKSKFRRLIPTRHHNKEVPDEGEWCSSNLWSSPASFRFCRTSKKSGLKALREEVWERGKNGNGLGWDEKSKNFKFKMKWETEKVWIGLPQLSTPGYWQTYCHPWLTVGHDLNKHFEFFKIIWAKFWRILELFYRQLLELCLLHPKVPVGVDFLATEILQRQYQKCKKVVNSKFDTKSYF